MAPAEPSRAPWLSIITVTYRDPEGLARTLASLARIKAALSIPWEHVIVDSSPALSVEALSPFAGAWPLSHIEEKPRGIYSAMNTGWRGARGRIIWFLNGGDEAGSAEAVIEACRRLEANPALDLISGAATLLRNGKVLYNQPARTGSLPLLGINRVCQQQLLYRRTLLEKQGGFSEEYRIAADYEFHLRALYAGAQQEGFSGVLVRFDRGGLSTDVARTFEEFRRVHRSLRAAHQLDHAWAHALVLNLERARIMALQLLDACGFGAILRRGWHALRRISKA